MAQQVVEKVKTGEISVEEIVSALRENQILNVCEKFGIPEISSTAFIYEYLAFLRLQSNSVEKSTPASNAVVTLSQPQQSLTPTPPNIPGKSKLGKGKLQKILPAEITAPSPKNDFVMVDDDFPSLGIESTPVKASKKKTNTVLLHSTPVSSGGNLKSANAPLALEGIFTRELPKSEKSAKKRASLTSSSSKNQNANQQKPKLTESPKKRIAPTPIKRWQQTSQTNFMSAQVSHSPKEATEHQREVVRSINQENCALQKEEFDEPLMEKVTSIEVLERLALLYARLLTCNLIPNIAEELSFVMQLLVIKIKPQNCSNDALLLSASNCAYFASQCLLNCGELLCLLKPSSVNLLTNIPHVKTFCLQLYTKICDLCNCERSFSLLRSSFLQGVSFDASVDSLENFPNASLFSAFRKQRDEFYNLLKQSQKISSEQQRIKMNFDSRVASIFNLSMDPCNLLHLAKLFVLQMVATCCGNVKTDELGNFSGNTLHELEYKSPEKLSIPRDRLEEQKASKPWSPQNQFPGQGTFFYHFLIVANYAQFHEHLKNVLVNSIIEEDKFDIAPEDADTSIDSQVREELYTVLFRLRLYGSFLGFLEYLPYSTTVESSPYVQDSHRSALINFTPRIDLENSLRESVKQKRILPTLLWVTSYFSAANPIVGSLPTFENVFTLLNSIFLSSDLNRPYFIINRLLIGWAFENLKISVDFSVAKMPLLARPDIEAFVDVQMIHLLCPFLTKIESILKTFNNATTLEARKIVPLTAPDQTLDSTGSLTKLEEAFFFMHPTSVRKTLNFVVERIPANVVKEMKPSLVMKFREEVKKEIKELVESGEKLTPALVDTLSQNLCPRFQLKAENIITPACEEQGVKILEELLKADCDHEGILVAKKLYAKQSHLRVLQWIRCHISKDYILKEVKEISKTVRDEQSTSAEDIENRPAENHYLCDSVVYIIDLLEQLLRKVLVEEIPTWKDCLARTERTMENRREWQSVSWNAVCRLLIDLGSLSIARYVNLEIADAVIEMLDKAKYVSERDNVDSPKNRYIIDKFCCKDRQLAKTMLAEYQVKLDVFKKKTPETGYPSKKEDDSMNSSLGK